MTKTNASVYIARKLKGDGTSVGKISRMGTRIATISVAVSVFTMILAIAIVRGFRTEIEKRAIGFTGEILMEAPGAGFVTEASPVSTALSYLPALKNHPEIYHIQEFVISYGIVRTEEALQAVSFKGVGLTYKWDFFEKHLTEGRLPVLTDTISSSEVLVSQRLSSMLGIGLEDVVTMYFIGNNVRMRRFVVCGIYDAQLEDVDNHLVIGDIRHAQRLNGWREDQVSGMELFLKDKDRPDTRLEEIEDFIIANSSDTDDGVVLRSIRRIYAHLYDWLDLMDINVVVLLTLMVLVAGFNMMSGLLILLFEKTSTIGLLKAVGMRDRHIRNSFLYNAAVVATRGMIAGTVLAGVFLVLQKTIQFIKLDPASYFVDSVPVDISWYHILAVDFAAVGILLLLLTLPLKSIIKISPDKAIRMR
ncbi:MAG: ABC transporter permease [Bacteroidales bacterium]|jgi:lipoprotein-releasing system permease protein|nr:ABC transporter permease [Bacteroidales bacterium]NLH23036.1 ABC transporter permease [Bacteroidales bacterium]HPJ82708.1 FtsX-like permease family protein [Bacteroidales bacterium]